MIRSEGFVAFEDYQKIKGIDVEVNRFERYDGGDIHTHDFIEAAFLSAGSGWHLLNGSLTRCKPGAFVIVDRGDSHMWMSEDDSSMVIYNLIFRPRFFDAAPGGSDYFSSVIGSFLFRGFDRDYYGRSGMIRLSDDRIPVVRRLFDSMLKEYTEHEMGFEEMMRAQAVELLVTALRCAELPAPGEGVMRREVDFTPATDYIAEHFAEKIKLSDLSKLMFLSEKYFSALFEEHMHMTVTEYIQRIRVARACAMLNSARASVSEVAMACGYGDVRFFNKLFLRYTGRTPTEYRRRRKEVIDSWR